MGNPSKLLIILLTTWFLSASPAYAAEQADRQQKHKSILAMQNALKDHPAEVLLQIGHGFSYQEVCGPSEEESYELGQSSAQNRFSAVVSLQVQLIEHPNRSYPFDRSDMLKRIDACISQLESTFDY